MSISPRKRKHPYEHSGPSVHSIVMAISDGEIEKGAEVMMTIMDKNLVMVMVREDNDGGNYQSNDRNVRLSSQHVFSNARELPERLWDHGKSAKMMHEHDGFSMMME